MQLLIDTNSASFNYMQATYACKWWTEFVAYISHNAFTPWSNYEISQSSIGNSNDMLQMCIVPQDIFFGQ